jgi:nitroreductase
MSTNAGDLSLFEVMYTTRAMRKLKPDDVPEELLVKLIDAANRAASGSNAQGARWLIVRDADQRQKIAALNKVAVDAYYEDQLANMPELPHQDAAKRKRMFDAVKWQGDNLQNIPAIIFACYDFGAPVPAEMRGMGMMSVLPGVQNLLLAARAHGLGATLTTLGLSNRDGIRDILGLPESVEAYAIVPVGYPMGKFGPVTRLPAEETICWDRWEG